MKQGERRWIKIQVPLYHKLGRFVKQFFRSGVSPLFSCHSDLSGIGLIARWDSRQAGM